MTTVGGDVRARVLVVDDDPVSRMMLAHVVQRAGYDVDEAESVASALSALDGTPVDAVISDYVMPGGSGLDLLDAMPDTGIPFVLLTGVMEIGELDDPRVDAVSAYLTKPFASHELQELLERLVPHA